MSFFRRFRGAQPAPPPPAHDPGEAFVIPTVLVRFFPVRDGRVDPAVTGDVDASLADIRRQTTETTRQVIQSLEQGSRYHGYKNASAPPSLRYQIVHAFEFLEPLPTWRKPGHSVPMTDYQAIMKRIDIRALGRGTGGQGGLGVGLPRRGHRPVGVEHGRPARRHQQQRPGCRRSARPGPDLHRLPLQLPARARRRRSRTTSTRSRPCCARSTRTCSGTCSSAGRARGAAAGRTIRPTPAAITTGRTEAYVMTDIEDWTPDGTGPRQRMNCHAGSCDSLTWFVYWMQNLPGAATA